MGWGTFPWACTRARRALASRCPFHYLKMHLTDLKKIFSEMLGESYLVIHIIVSLCKRAYVRVSRKQKAHLRCNVVFTVTLACTKRVLFITKIKRVPLVFEKHWGEALCLPVPTPLPELPLRGTRRQLK